MKRRAKAIFSLLLVGILLLECAGAEEWLFYAGSGQAEWIAAGPFVDGYACVKTETGYCLVAYDGTVTPAEERDGTLVAGGIARALDIGESGRESALERHEDANGVYYTDSEGKVRLSGASYGAAFSEGYAIVKIDGEWCILEESEVLQRAEDAAKTEQKNVWRVGDVVTFGSYEQDGDTGNGAEDIEWIVLEDKGDGEYVLISKYGLDALPYNAEYLEDTDINWEMCSLRAWLNDEFYRSAFTEDERKQITLTYVKNDDNPETGREGGNDTQDYVYLLSIDEANRYFENDDARVCFPTAHAVENGAYVYPDTGVGWWWLRSPGTYSYNAAEVSFEGWVCGHWDGSLACDTYKCVRPVIVVCPAENGADASKNVIESESGKNDTGEDAGYPEQKNVWRVGDVVTFGSYEQDGNASNGAEAIEWIVLEDKGDGEYLLISKYGLEAKEYNTQYTSVTWETCSLRAWLNGEFYNSVFTEDEKKLIAQTTVKNDDDPSSGTEGGNDTQDYVYLLSIDEVNKYFANDNARVCYPTSHTVENGAYTNEDTGAGWWWLRSPGRISDFTANVLDGGNVNGDGIYVVHTYGCVRPVVVARLPEDGTVNTKDAGTNDGEDEQPANQTEETQDLKVGDVVAFGSYEQDGDASNGAEAIEWIVLEDKGDGEYVLISKYGIEAKAYNEEDTSVTWETCTLRAWLNGEFYNSAFTEDERQLIAQTRVKNDDNAENGTEGGNDTQDYVYLLSVDEANGYFADDDARVCYPTAHAEANGAYTNSDTGAGWWWLRSPGSSGDYAAGVGISGAVSGSGDCVNYTDVCARPVVVARLAEDGTVITDDAGTTAGEDEQPAEQTEEMQDLKVGDTVTFGSYEQDGDASNGAEAIEWIVLEDKGNGEYVLISKYGLEAKPYNEEKTDVTWETCTLRAWLNGDFYDTAFTEDERKLIAQTTVKNDDNPSYGTEGGRDTLDYVYLLSIDEVNAYFDGGEERVCEPTAHTIRNGAAVLTQEQVNEYQSYYDYPLTVGAGWWWLRSPGEHSYDAACVGSTGSLIDYGYSVSYPTVCVRPVICVQLDDDEDDTEYSLDSSKAFVRYMEEEGREWEYAGKTDSGSEYFLVTVDEDTQPVKIYVVFDTDNKGAVMYAFKIASIRTGKLNEAIEKCDEANAGYSWAKWTLDTDDNTITAQGDVIFRDDNVGEITWHMCKVLADIVDDFRSNFDGMAE